MFPLFLLVASFACFVRTQGVRMDNVYCESRREIVTVDPAEHKYFPYFVELHRCSGSWHLQSPAQRRCVAKQWKDISIDVYQIITKEYKTVIVQNHTECEPGCVEKSDGCDTDYEYWDEENCKCTCLYDDHTYQLPANLGPKEGFRWNPSLCRNECARAPLLCLHINQVWEPHICDCTCTREVVERCEEQKTGLDFETCQCVDVAAVKNNRGAGTHPRSHMFITLLMGEAFVIIVLVCAIIHWVRKARSLNTKDLHPECHRETDSEEPLALTEHAVAMPPTGSKYSLESGVDGCLEDGPPETSARDQEIV